MNGGRTQRCRRVLVTGATGFIGAAVSRALLRHGYQVRALVRPGACIDNLAGLDVEMAAGDLGVSRSLIGAVDGCDGIVHAAADYRLWTPDPGSAYRTNVDGTRALLDAATDAGVKRLVYTGSVATLATDPSNHSGDESRPAPLEQMTGHYKRSKWLAEQLVLERARQGLPAIVAVPSAPFGPGDIKPTPTGRIVLDLLQGRMPAYVDTGLNVVHVDDVAEGHVLALERGVPGERYILGGENLMLREILAEACRHAGRRPPRVRLPLGLVMPVAWTSEMAARLTRRPPRVSLEGVRLARNRMFFTSARAGRDLGYRARPAAEAIADSVDWFMHRLGRQFQTRPMIERS